MIILLGYLNKTLFTVFGFLNLEFLLLSRLRKFSLAEVQGAISYAYSYLTYTIFQEVIVSFSNNNCE